MPICKTCKVDKSPEYFRTMRGRFYSCKPCDNARRRQCGKDLVGRSSLVRPDKKCTGCRVVKPIDQFGITTRAIDGRAWKCRDCISQYTKKAKAAPGQFEKRQEERRRFFAAHPDYKRNEQLKRLYGITASQFDEMHQRQGGRCAICGEHEDNLKTPVDRCRPLHIDHSHETGVVRGLLCYRCNTGIGQFDDSPEMMETAAEYLRASRKVVLRIVN